MKKILYPVLAVLLFAAGCSASGTSAQVTRSGSLNVPSAEITVSAADNQDMEDSSVLGVFSTNFNPKYKSRSHNIKRASDTIHQCVIQPDETFSFNQTVGPTGRKYGYQLGTIFIKGRMYEGYGGGVCQVSSTLYNAAVNAGMTILERHDHSMPVPYIETGKDAATSYGGIDFKFKNSQPYPVMIETYGEDGTITITLSAV